MTTNPTRRIGWLLALIFFIPAAFFSVYEISSLNRDEEMIQNVYDKQLDAILFSVNQYSDDVINSWISRIQNSNELSSDSIPARMVDLLNYNPSLRYIFSVDSGAKVSSSTIRSLQDIDDSLVARIDSALRGSHEKIDQLISYRRSGFQKVDALAFDWQVNPPLQCLLYISISEEGNANINGLLIDPEEFILDVIGPRLQVIAKDKFILSVFRKGLETAVYTTVRSDSITIKAEAQTKDLWFFPQHALGIRTKGASLQELVDKRTTTNLYLLIALNLVLVVAVVLVFRNVKREVQLAQNKADFVSNVSHEIRTPLALISMFAETLEMGRVISEEKKKEYYSIISKETQRLTGIVNKILNFSQTEAKKKVLTPVPLDANQQIREILRTYDYHLKSKGFDYSFSEEGPLTVSADGSAFGEVVINLIDNAIKYSGTMKKIEIRTSRQGEFGSIVVRDYGIGIHPSDQKHIFDKFYRVSRGNLANVQGTGIGLSLVKQLMEAQHGKVTVKSELNNGSQFTLYFPIDKKQA